MFKYTKSLTVLAALGFGLAACSNSDTVRLTPQPNLGGNGSSVKYTQIERLSRPAVKEVFENFSDHATSNGLEPYDPNDPLKASIKGTENFVRYGGKPPASGDYGTVLQGALFPDQYTVDLSQTSGGFLGADFPGKFPGAGPFGGRNINDDVIGLELLALFGNGLTLAGIPDDMKENNCLSTQNLPSDPNAYPSQTKIAAFPYLPNPH